MNWEVLLSSANFYLEAGFLSLVFGLPLGFFLYKSRKPINLFLIYIFGVLNFLFCLFVYANFNHFWDIRKLDVVAFCMFLLAFELMLLGRRFRELGGKVRVESWRYFGVVFLVGLVIFYCFNLNYWDPNEKRFFNPGYGVNHDHIVTMSVIKSFITKDEGSTLAVKNYYNLFRGSGYPIGGTYVNMFFAKLLGADPYFVYQRVLVWVCLLNLFVISYFVLDYFEKISLLGKAFLLVTSVLSVFNFLSLSMINSSVFASSAVIPLVMLSILWSLRYFKLGVYDGLFLVVLGLTQIAVFFIYSCFGGIFYFLFLMAVPVVYGRKAFKGRFWLVILLVFVFSIILPLNMAKIVSLFKILFTSSNTEVNLFKGMAGNTIGFVNPMLAFSIWFSSPDFRFFAANHYNTWLVFSLMGMLFLIMLTAGIKGNVRKLILALMLPYVVLIAVSFWLTKSPYQSAKALQAFSCVWPLILFLLLYNKFMSRKWWLRVVVIVYMGIYSFYALKSVAFAFSYIGKPIVRSNYELMKIGPEFCRGEDSKLFVGRDESSAYFLVDCENINFAYDRFSNNAAFWEVIALNKLSSLDQKCGVDSWKLTAIDFSLYEKVLIDKCFKFENNSFRLVKEFDGYRWYEKVR